MEECACLCGLGSSRGCSCPQEPQDPAETAAAEGKRCPQKRPRPADTAEAEGKRLAQVCTKFRRILHTDTIWRRRCREEFGVCENLQDLETVGTSYREVYAKLLHPHRHILGLWQRDAEGLKTLLYAAVDGLGITGWTYVPCLHTLVDGPMQFMPAFRIRLTETKSAAVECMEGRHRRPHCRRLQIRKDRFQTWCQKTDHLNDFLTLLRQEWGRMLVLEDRQQYDCRTYRRLYLPSNRYGPMIAVLSFHGKCARVTEITGTLFQTLQIHLTRRIEMRGGEIFGDVDVLSLVVREMEEQGARSTDHNYPGTCRMCFYGVRTSTSHGFTESSTGVVTLFDENLFGFLCLQERAFRLFRRVQNTFRNAEAPSPQAFLEMLSSIRS
ncbi:F-box only protein 31-like [Myotis daubentonii]|uniref:F-box only protein 31-like n=1 Tax=Myotis daubentonii TaxID=98922 RepID=UPI0028735788|nr:F-box only protein 31-like [Myotis daubentonii]